MKNYKVKYKIKYSGYIVVEGENEKDALDLLEDYYTNGDLARTEYCADEVFGVVEVKETNQEPELYSEPPLKKRGSE